MLLDLKKIFFTEGEKQKFSLELNMAETEIDGVNPFVSLIDAKGVVENRAGLVVLVINAEFDYKKPCDRCTTDTTKHMCMQFTHNLAVTLSGSDNDDYIETPDYTLDLDELLRSDILLELPIKYLCKDDCKGICQKCGKDLNQSGCDCDNRQIDPRLEVLKKLIDSE